MKDWLARMLTRDHIVWSLLFIASVLTYIVGSTTHLIPESHVAQVKEIAGLLAFISGKLGNSPLPGSNQ